MTTPSSRLRHASGYLGLNMIAEARDELALIPREDWNRRDVLEARLDLHMAAKEWELLAGFGQQMARRYPEVERGWILWAYALRELERVSEARDVLLEAEPLHGQTSPILVIDDATVITGSFNFTRAAEERNAENLLVIRDPQVGRALPEELDRAQGAR